MNELINISEYPVKDVLKILLKDKTTERNIIWATDVYAKYGEQYTDKNQITMDALLGQDNVQIVPRISKALEEQKLRTRQKAEVMTPVWLCNTMNNYLDEEWFGRTGVFNTENADHTWTKSAEPIPFDKTHSWRKYVDSRRLEITCGEAPYLVSRYDTTTGELIEPPDIRIGLLDRKLRVVNENTSTEAEWLKWAERSVQSCYGYEYQGDNLLIARVNVYLSFYEYYKDRWQKEPDLKILKRIANIISWNIWQMDGLKDCVPLGKPIEVFEQTDLFSLFPDAMGEDENAEDRGDAAPLCRIYNWRSNESKIFKEYKEG